VDDPFDQVNGIPNVSILDPDNPTTGPDNRGAEGVALPWTTSKATEANGKARVQFTVSMQPGDNYRAGASVLSDAPAQADQTDADAADDGFVGKPGDFAEYKVPLTWSPMLTVWRHLWIERDTMAAPDAAVLRGVASVAGVGPTPGAPGLTTVNVWNASNLSFDMNNYEEGFLSFTNCPSGVDRFPIVESYSSPDLPHQIVVFGTPGACAVVGTGCTLLDDDVSALGTPGNPRFPNGDDLLKTAFAPAYIEPLYVSTSYETVVPFQEYLNASDVFYGFGSWDDGRSPALVSSNGFWSCLIVGAWEGSDTAETGREHDGDPDYCNSPYSSIVPPTAAESVTTGVTDAASGRSAIFFQGLADDAACNPGTDEAHTVVHEIGHTCGVVGMHSHGGIMTEGAPKYESRFTAITLKTFREQNPW
jgi:hypothetical protein